MASKIAKNTILLYLRMVLVMLINLLVVRIVFNALGEVDYGIYNIIAGVVIMFQGISTVLTTSTQRFYSYYIGANLKEQLSDIYTVSINIYAIFCFCSFVVAETLGIWFINNFLEIPDDRIVAANLLYQFSIIAFIFTVLQAPFSSIFLSFEDMNLFAIVSMIDAFMKLIFSWLIYMSNRDRLILYGIVLMSISIFSFLIYNIICHKKYDVCNYHRLKDKNLYKQLLSFSGWHLFSSMASVGMNQINNFLVNIFFGVIANASRAIALQINSALSSFSGNFILAIRPPMIKAYAEGNYKKLNTLFALSNKTVYYLMLAIILPTYFTMDTVLKLWLGNVDGQAVFFSKLILIYALILSINNPISIIIQATGQIQKYYIYVETFTLLCPIATYIFYRYGFPVEYTFYCMIASISLAHIIRLICLHRVYEKFDVKEYFMGFIIPALFITMIAIVVMSYISGKDVPFMVFYIIAIVTIISLAVLLGLNTRERGILGKEVVKILHK